MCCQANAPGFQTDFGIMVGYGIYVHLVLRLCSFLEFIQSHCRSVVIRAIQPTKLCGGSSPPGRVARGPWGPTDGTRRSLVFASTMM